MPNGYVIFDGASLHNGERIIAIALTSKSTNSKTGSMMQTYIITPHNPMYASKHGLDDANCGNCPHRGTPTDDPKRKQAKGRTCYVKLFQGVYQVWKQWSKGAYPSLQGHEALALLGADKDVMDYEADAAKVGRTFRGQLAKAYMGLRSLPTPFNIASRAIGNISDFVKEQAAKRAEAQAKAAAAAAAQMQYENRRDETGGYQSSFGQDTGFMEGSGTSKDMGSFKRGGLATMFTRRR